MIVYVLCVLHCKTGKWISLRECLPQVAAAEEFLPPDEYDGYEEASNCYLPSSFEAFGPSHARTRLNASCLIFGREVEFEKADTW